MFRKIEKTKSKFCTGMPLNRKNKIYLSFRTGNQFLTPNTKTNRCLTQKVKSKINVLAKHRNNSTVFENDETKMEFCFTGNRFLTQKSNKQKSIFDHKTRKTNRCFDGK